MVKPAIRLNPIRKESHKTSFTSRQHTLFDHQKVFDLVEITMMQHGTAYDNVYNFDETGYARIIAMQK